jgi:hypothetical protein
MPMIGFSEDLVFCPGWNGQNTVHMYMEVAETGQESCSRGFVGSVSRHSISPILTFPFNNEGVTIRRIQFINCLIDGSNSAGLCW